MTPERPLFSVVIPAYNRALTIGQTLESVAAQRFRDFETIVVDDGSTDITCDLVASFEFVQLIRQANGGPGTARNRAVIAAKGTYVAFLDSDDVWFPWTLSTYADVIEQHNQPVFVTGKQYCFSEFSDLRRIRQDPLYVESYADYFASADAWRWYGVSSFVIRRDILTAVGGFEEGAINGEDADLAMRLGTAPGFVHITSPTSFAYRNHLGNVTLDHSKSELGVNLLLSNERAGKYPGHQLRRRERWRIISRHVRPFAIDCAKRGHFRQALFYYYLLFPELFWAFRVKYLLALPSIAIWGAIKKIALSAHTK